VGGGGGGGGWPLACQKNGKFYLAGVVSMSKLCHIPSIPGLFTNVTFFMEWIEKNRKNDVKVIVCDE